MLENAAKDFERVLRARVPSMTLPLKTMFTPHIPSEQAQMKASRRFTLESVESKPMGFCAPVSMTGFPEPLTI